MLFLLIQNDRGDVQVEKQVQQRYKRNCSYSPLEAGDVQVSVIYFIL